MIKELTEEPTWNVLDSRGEMYTVNVNYRSSEGDTIIGLTSKDTGYYDEWFLHDFYREFTFVSEESL